MVKGLMRQSVHPMTTSEPDHNLNANNSNNSATRIADRTEEDTALPMQILPESDKPGAPVPAALHRPNSREQPVGDGSGRLNSEDMVMADPTGTEDPPWDTPSTTKSGRQLVFADEVGGALAEINYSNRTHYSKQAGSGSLTGPGRACCALM